MPKPNQSATWDFKFKRKRFQTTSKKIKQKQKSRYECHIRITLDLTWHSGGTVEILNFKQQKNGYLKEMSKQDLSKNIKFGQVHKTKKNAL